MRKIRIVGLGPVITAEMQEVAAAARFDRLKDVDELVGMKAEQVAQQIAILRQEASQSYPKKGSHQPYKKIFSDVGRNEPCPCGSGKKFKKCCL